MSRPMGVKRWASLFNFLRDRLTGTVCETLILSILLSPPFFSGMIIFHPLYTGLGSSHVNDFLIIDYSQSFKNIIF